MSRLTRLVLAHKRLVVAFWVFVTVAAVAALGPAGASLSQQFDLPGREGFETNRQLAATYGNGGDVAPIVPVVRLPAGTTVDSPSVRADLGAAVPFYGSSPDPEEVARIRAPLLVQSAEVDPRINERWPEFEAALRAANVSYERHLYPGTQHGFHNDTTPRYDESAAKLAWERTLAFLDRHLGD